MEQTIRVFIRGISSDISESDFEDKFKSFGKVSNIYIPKGINSVHLLLDLNGEGKGFGFLSISNASQNPIRCIKLLNKTKWNNSVLTLEIAKMDYKEKLEKEWELERLELAKLKTYQEMPFGEINSFKIHVLSSFFLFLRVNVFFLIKCFTKILMKMEILYIPKLNVK